MRSFFRLSLDVEKNILKPFLATILFECIVSLDNVEFRYATEFYGAAEP